MPQHDLPLILVTRHLDGDLYAGEALFFPEVVAVHADPDRLLSTLRGLAKKILADSAPLEIHRRMSGEAPEVGRVSLSLEPPKPSAAWSEPVTLELDVLRWRHGQEASIAYVPALGIEVVAARDEQLDELVPRHVRVALARTKAAERLFELAQLARVQSVSVTRDEVTADLKTPAQIAADRTKEKETARPVIDDVGSVLDDAHTPPAHEIGEVVSLLADALIGRTPRSVLLVGPSGVGKTAAFGQLFRERRNHRLAHAPFWATSGARLIAGMTGYGLWQERCQQLCRQAKRDGAILRLGNLVELMEVGKAGGSQFGIANFFRPYLARGDVLAVAECTPEQLPVIERSSPQLLSVFQQIVVNEPPPAAVATILRNAAAEFAARRPRAPGGATAAITAPALDTVVRLHRRYATYSAAPGRPLRFLKNLLHDRFQAPTYKSPAPPIAAALTPAEVTAAFSRETGLPLVLLDDATPLDLAAARQHFAGRVIGQRDAVDRVTDLLATVKAALNRPRRPIASLLFIGPTGVGKTEMAKALAEYFFGDSKGGRLVRFDMSEYATAGAVARLVGTAWETEGLLTSKVREQPFCVLLLDEFEKAHPAFFDLLLQVLGEGRLTDSAGRLADFSNAIVVMTSNLGAESFGAGPFGLARATTGGAARARDHFTDAVRDFLRPELFNRIDRVVPFLPLDEETIRLIAAREIALVTRRDGLRGRDVRLDVSPAAVAHLARAGYEPLYGARPLKRRIEQDLLAPLADAMNQYAAATPLIAIVDVRDGHLDVTVRAATTSPPSSILHPPSSLSRASTLRRRARTIARCPAALSVQNELFTLRRQVDRAAARPGRGFVDPATRERLKRLEAAARADADLTAGATALEEALLLNLYEAAPLPWEAAELRARLDRLEADAAGLLLRLFTLDQPDPHSIVLACYGNAPAELFSLARAYREVATSQTPADADVAGPAAVQVAYYTRLGKTAVGRTAVDDDRADAFLQSPRPGVLGIVLSIRAAFARSRFESETGLHVLVDEANQNSHPILVDAAAVAPADYRPPRDVEFRVALAGQRRRTYAAARQEADDPVTGQKYRWPARAMAQALAAATDDRLRRRLEDMLAGKG